MRPLERVLRALLSPVRPVTAADCVEFRDGLVVVYGVAASIDELREAARRVLPDRPTLLATALLVAAGLPVPEAENLAGVVPPRELDAEAEAHLSSRPVLVDRRELACYRNIARASPLARCLAGLESTLLDTPLEEVQTLLWRAGCGRRAAELRGYNVVEGVIVEPPVLRVCCLVDVNRGVAMLDCRGVVVEVEPPVTRDRVLRALEEKRRSINDVVEKLSAQAQG